MQHRHLNHQHYSLAAIDDVIARGQWQDWADLRQAVLTDESVPAKVKRVCRLPVKQPRAAADEELNRQVIQARENKNTKTRLERPQINAE